jgi:hypothetical protein
MAFRCLPNFSSFRKEKSASKIWTFAEIYKNTILAAASHSLIPTSPHLEFDRMAMPNRKLDGQRSSSSSVWSYLYMLILSVSWNVIATILSMYSTLRDRTLKTLAPKSTHEYVESETKLVTTHKAAPTHVGAVIRFHRNLGVTKDTQGVDDGMATATATATTATTGGTRMSSLSVSTMSPEVEVKEEISIKNEKDAIRMIEDVASLACWCLTAGSRHLTVYDEHGKSCFFFFVFLFELNLV